MLLAPFGALSGTGIARDILVMLTLLLGIALFFSLQVLEPLSFDSDQIMTNLMVEKRLHPEVLQRDALYSKSDIIQRYIPLYIALLARLSTDGNYVTGFRRLAILTGLVFLSSHYILFRYIGANPAFAALGSISALTLRGIFGGEYWGFNGIAALHARGLANALTPLLLIGLLHWRDSWRALLFFGLTGLTVLLHPVSGLHLFLAGAVYHVFEAVSRVAALVRVLVGVMAFVLCSSPFLIRHFSGLNNVGDPALFPLIREIQMFRWRYLFLPPEGSMLANVAVHMALPVVTLLVACRFGEFNTRARRLLVFGLLAFGAGFLTTALIQLAGSVLNVPYVTYEQLRMTKLVYPGILTGFPLVYQAFFRRTLGWRVLGVGILALSMVSPQDLIVRTHGLRVAAKQRLGIAAVVAESPREKGTGKEARRMYDWVRAHTSKDALFLSDSIYFRVATLRSITGTFKDGGIIALSGTRPLVEWYDYITKVRACRRLRGESCWFDLARQYRVDYVVVDPDLSRAGPRDSGFVRVWAEGGWSVWMSKHQ